MRWVGWLDLNNQSSVDWRLTEDLLSRLAWLEQSIQRRLKTSWRLAEPAGLTWTLNPAWAEDLLSRLAWLEHSIQRGLKTCWAGWLDLNTQSSVGWRLAEPAGLTWTLNPAWAEDFLKTCWAGWLDLNTQSSVGWRLPEDLLSRLAWLEQSLVMVYPCQSTVHQASSLLRRRRLFFNPGRSVPVHQASSLLRRRRLFFNPGRSVSVHSPPSVKPVKA